VSRRLAISDIHGCLRTFDALLERVALTPDDTLYLLGDYVDRGPDSKGVIDRIWDLQARGYNLRCITGNHEQIVLDDYKTENSYLNIRTGDEQFLESFGVTRTSDIPVQYIDWMRTLDTYIVLDDYILVHAGLNMELSDPLTDLTSMIWIRRWYEALRDRAHWLEGKIIVHGHTPTSKTKIEQYPAYYSELPVQPIDAGCFATYMEGMGHLCCFDLDARTLVFEPNVDMLPS
jgi:serine/threonine protein phosphatase 1